MKYEMVAVRDSAADVFGVPQFTASIGVAVRSFADEVNRKDERNPFHAHPDDFELYHVGTYHDEKATFEPIEPRLLSRGKDVFRGDK